MRIEGRLDTTGLIGGESVAGNLEIPLKSDAEDEAFLLSLENFELLELPAVGAPQEVVGTTEEMEPAATAEIVESTIANSHVIELKVEDEVTKVSKLVINETPVDLERTDAVVNFPKPVVPVEDEEQFKVIGTLKIGIPLYNVYLNEADEWSRCLVTELDEWAIEHHKPLNISTVNFAHSLAGSSATVGFYQLSGLAKKLEHALDKVLQKENGSDTEAVVFAQAAEECRRLLHQFAAGFLEDPKASVLARLESLKFSESKPVVKENATSINATTAAVAVVSAVALPKIIEKAQSKQASVNEALVTSSIASQSEYSKQAVAHRVVQDLENDDDIDLVDSLDPDLFHVFEEEARDLLPNLGSSLRQWVSHPDDMNARSEALRTLHTLKGSSRLAGAMRLGELSHRMESEIESLGSENLSSKSIEPLLARLDGLQTIFEVITKPLDADVLSKADLHLDEAAKLNQNSSEEKTLKTIEDKSSSVDQPSKQRQNTSSQSKTVVKPPAVSILKADKRESRQSVRVRARLLDRLVNQAGEVMLTRTRIESELGQLRGSLGDLTGNLDRLRQQLRDVEFQAETQMQSRMEQAKGFAKKLRSFRV